MGRSLTGMGDIQVEDGAWREVPDYMLGPFWVRDFCPDISTKDYGSNDFHGRFHPAIPYVAMKRFTKPGEVVWDCFAGSGTTLDVGNELDRQVIANDLNSVRPDILRADTSVWNPGKDSVDLVIAHPPYMGIIDYDCPMTKVKHVGEYVEEFSECVYNMLLALRSGRVLVLVIGEIWKDGQLYPLEYPLDNLMRQEYGCRLLGRIVKDFGETKGGIMTAGKYTNLWKYRLLKWGYFRNGIDTILFYQK